MVMDGEKQNIDSIMAGGDFLYIMYTVTESQTICSDEKRRNFSVNALDHPTTEVASILNRLRDSSFKIQTTHMGNVGFILLFLYIHVIMHIESQFYGHMFKGFYMIIMSTAKVANDSREIKPMG